MPNPADTSPQAQKIHAIYKRARVKIQQLKKERWHIVADWQKKSDETRVQEIKKRLNP
jgi:hypothetical protein